MTQIELTPTASLTGKWKPYPAYKDSSVEWLGKIPVHWEVKRLKFTCQINPSKSDALHFPIDMEVSFLPMELIREDGTISLEETRLIEQVRQGYTYFRNGDVIIAKITPCFENGKGALCSGLINGIGFGTTELYVLRPKKENNPKFIFYLTKSEPFREIGAAMMQGAAGQQRVPEEFVSNFQIGFPPLPEQQAIATFLDYETARINTLIAKKERLIELLQEKRSALISHVVTKGLDPTVQMKDSGVEWLGEIPAHWEVKRLKFCLDSIEQGWSPTCENRPTELDEWGVLKVGCVNGVKFNPDENKALPAETQPIPEFEIKQGDVLVSRANTRELLGSASVVTNVRPHLLLCDKLYRLKILLDTVNPIYLVLAMGSSTIRFQLERDATGASNSMQNISQGTILNLVIPLPDISKQQTIATYLDRETAKIDALISRIRDGIEKLREYSAALISAAVTGKINVREEITLPGDEDLSKKRPMLEAKENTMSWGIQNEQD
jgi:type I restriction enzyme, S subunit